jgi:hypothetical protein
MVFMQIHTSMIQLLKLKNIAKLIIKAWTMDSKWGRPNKIEKLGLEKHCKFRDLRASSWSTTIIPLPFQNS